jgi:hypothetical protein
VWYQVDASGTVPCCAACGERLRSSPVYDGYPFCKRKRCVKKRAVAAREWRLLFQRTVMLGGRRAHGVAK